MKTNNEAESVDMSFVEHERSEALIEFQDSKTIMDLRSILNNMESHMGHLISLEETLLRCAGNELKVKDMEGMKVIYTYSRLLCHMREERHTLDKVLLSI